MASALDSSLDQIIAAKKKSSRAKARGSLGRKTGGGAKKTKTPGVVAMDVDSTAATKKAGKAKAKNKEKVKAVVAAAGSEPVPQSTKIVISNLPPDVTEAHIRELFSQTIGNLKAVGLAFDSNGRSKGSATVEFKKPGDANRAFKKYNGVLIDKTRPIKIEILFDPADIPRSLASRLAPLPAKAKVAATNAAVVSGSAKQAPQKKAPTKKQAAKKGKKKGGVKVEKKTVEQLDQEMMDWEKEKGASA